MWNAEGEAGINPFLEMSGLEEIVPGVAFVSSFANFTVFDTLDGLVLIDSGAFFNAAMHREVVRGWSTKRVHTIVFSHGQVDHAFGAHVYDDEALAQGIEPPQVVAHENVPARLDRYQFTAGYNGIINQRQFSAEKPLWPDRYRYPDQTYRDRHTLEVGGVTFELHHSRGETDDHTWVWVPAYKLLCSGDMFIWVSPNCGNPQKVQRYAKDWAAGLREMMTYEAEMLFPGHGPPIFGAERVRQALDETARFLESIVEQTLELMNQGAPLDTILQRVQAPAELLARPYLKPVYDEPEFVVRNLWRLYGGWYDGNPANLKPAPDDELAREVAALAGGAERLASRARELADAGNHRLATHLVEWAGRAAPNDEAIQRQRSSLYNERANSELSLMAKGIFSAAARRR